MNSPTLVTSPGGFDAFLVSASVAIAIAGAYAALDVAARAQADLQRRFTWITAAALVFGAGVWSMHFVGMLAYQSSMPLIAASLVAVLVASWCGFNLSARRSTRWWTIPVAGAITGAGVCAMHYIGMAGMQVPAEGIVRLFWAEGRNAVGDRSCG